LKFRKNLTDRKSVKSCVIYLTKKQNFACLLNCRYCADSAQNLPQPVPNNVLKVLQISSKSVSFRRSYSRTREYRQIAPQSKFNIRPKPIFEPNNNDKFHYNTNLQNSVAVLSLNNNKTYLLNRPLPRWKRTHKTHKRHEHVAYV